MQALRAWILLLSLQSNIHLYITMERKKEQKQKDFYLYLRAKKARDGKLNKAGEWLLKQEGSMDEYWMDMKAVLK